MNEIERGELVIAFETEVQRVAALGRQLDTLQYWLPAAGLRTVVRRTENLLANTRARLTAKPVVTLVGPNGSGKSTLANAIVGSDDLATVGPDRPTTRIATLITRSAVDAQTLQDPIPHAHLEVIPHAATRLPEAILVDTPDTNSGECAEHRPIVEQVLERTDVMVCVFQARNPKERDNILALADWVNAFPGSQVFLVLNHCDRIPEDELKYSVLPDFRRHIAQAWAREPDRIFMVSGRAGLQAPHWTENETPLHAINQVDELRDALRGLGGGTLFSDQRLARARHLRTAAQELTHKQIEPLAAELSAIQEELHRLEKELARAVMADVAQRMREDSGNVTALLGGALAQRWGGPVGLFVGLWRRLIDFWNPLSLARLLNPLLFPVLLARALRVLRNPEKYEQVYEQRMLQTTATRDFTAAKITAAREWPPIAERLIACGFNPDIRDVAVGIHVAPLDALSQQAWANAVRRAIDEIADRASRSWLQWFFNTPSIVGLIVAAAGFIAWPFIYHAPLPRDYYPHGVGLLLLLWLLPSLALQYRVMRAQKKVPQLALRHAQQAAQESQDPAATASISTELSRIQRLTH